MWACVAWVVVIDWVCPPWWMGGWDRWDGAPVVDALGEGWFGAPSRSLWEDVLRMAAVAAGEARGVPDGVYLVVSTMRNRQVDWGQPLDRVLSAYYASPQTPTSEELAQALRGYLDPYPRIYYALSLQDIKKLDADPDLAAISARRNRVLALYLYERWPAGTLDH